MKSNVVDKLVSWFNPIKGAKRMESRARMEAYSGSGYTQPGVPNNRFMQSIVVDQNSPDYDTLEARDGSVAMSRDMWMNNSLAQAIIRRIKTNVVGSGLKLQAQIKRDFLQLSKEDAIEWQRNTERRFKNWANSKDCDITRQQNFYELQDLVFLSVLLSGDVSVLYPQKSVRTLNSALRVRLIESDLLSNPQYTPDTNEIAGGIKLDSNGAPEAYFYSNFYPGGNRKLYYNMQWTEIKAFARNGNRQVHHLFFKERPGQRRGMPLLAPVVEDLVRITKLKEAELTAHVISSFFTVFVKDQSGLAPQPIYEGFVSPSVNEQEGNNVPNPSDNKHSMGSGNVVYLSDDKDISIADPRRMSEAFEPFFKSFVEQISAAVELPHEQLMMHFQSSYSAARGALLEGWKAIRSKRAWLSNNFCQPTYQAWLDEQVASGQIIAPGYFEDLEIRSAWSNTVWAGMGNGQLDPLKETRASINKINNGLSSHEKEYNAVYDDGDWEGTMDTLEGEREYLRERNLLPIATVEALAKIQEDNVPRDPATGNPNDEPIGVDDLDIDEEED